MSNILERIKIRKEDELRERLENHPLYSEVRSLCPIDVRGVYDDGLRMYLREGAELTAQSYDALFTLINQAAGRLGVSIRARVFKMSRPDGTENATVRAAGDDALIVFHDGLLNTVSDGQSLTAILGHELGHYGFAHTSDSASHAMILLGTRLNALEDGQRSADARALRGLQRHRRWEELRLLRYLLSQVCELNADRAGLLCANDFEASVRGFMCLSAGPADRFGRYEATAYLDQAKELLARDDVFVEDDAFSTHPLEPLRVLALEHFANSDAFREITGQGSGIHSLDSFDALLARVIPLKFLEPVERRSVSVAAPTPAAESPTAAVPVLSEHEHAWLAYFCVAAVLLADGKLTPREEAFFSQQVRPAERAERIIQEARAMTDEQFDAARTAVLEKARVLPSRVKTSLIKLMIKATKADRRVTETELAAIDEMAVLLNHAEGARRQIENSWGKNS